MSADPGPIDHRSVRHWGGFIISGLTAFAVDVAVTWTLVQAALDPFSARVFGIFVAMVVAWLMHRRITFNVPYGPSLGELLRFVVAASTANATNYGVYAAILLFAPVTPVPVAIVISTGIAAVVAYLGFRFGVFRRFQEDRPD